MNVDFLIENSKFFLQFPLKVREYVLDDYEIFVANGVWRVKKGGAISQATFSNPVEAFIVMEKKNEQKT